MYHVEMEQQHNSMEYLNQPSPSLLEEGDRPMHNSIDMRRIVGEEHALVTHFLYYDFMHYFTMFMQAMTPRRSIISCKLHGQYWATKIFEFGHSLGGKREILQHDG